MMQRLLLSGLASGFVLGGAMMSGCATASKDGASTSSAPAWTYPSAQPPLLKGRDAFAAAQVFTGDGERTDWATVQGAARNAEVVICAEQHGHPIGLSVAAALWRSILSTAGSDRPALALEFFERDEQSRLDDYLAGLGSEEVFLKRTGKTPPGGGAKNPWESNYPPGHRDMIEAAKEAKPPAPVYAANAPRQYVRLARTGGYKALMNLTAEQQRLFVLPRFAGAGADGEVPDNRYWHDFLKFMDLTPDKYAASSAADREKADGMFRSQSMWDATMADSVRQALAEGHRPVVLVVGQFHADYSSLGGGGTVQALKAVRPETKIVVVSFQNADPKGAWRSEDKDRADFVIYMGKNHNEHEEAAAAPAKH